METDILRDPPTASVSLRVTEATPKDLGRGIARLDPQTWRGSTPASATCWRSSASG